MSKESGNKGDTTLNEGYVPSEHGYKPERGRSKTGGHKPEPKVKPVNPPKKK